MASDPERPEAAAEATQSSHPRPTTTIRDLLRSAGLDVGVALHRRPTGRTSLGARVGRYEITGFLGAGGMGEVLRAFDPELGREVAVKLMRGAPQRASLARFVMEARVIGQLGHPSILPVHDLGVSDVGEVYFAMPLVEGRNLKEILQAGRRGAPMPRQIELLQVFQKVADAVAYAHKLGVVHCDLKPSNVMVGEFGRVYLLDWGICHILGNDELEDASSKVVGTPAYMAPERFDAQAATTPALDIYALGAILYAILAGEAPYRGPADLVVSQVRGGLLVPPRRQAPEREIPFELEAVVMKAMAHLPSARYATVGELQADIEAFLEGRLLSAVSYSAVEIARRWAREQRGAVLAFAAFMVTAVVLGGAALVHGERMDERAEANLTAFRRLASLGQIAELELELKQLWPPYPDNADAMLRWRDHAEALVVQAQTVDDLPVGSGLSTDELAWLEDQRTTLRARGADLKRVLADVESRIAFSRTVERRTVGLTAAWRDAAVHLASDARFPGVELVPMLGLVPLGPDPDTGLLEFADLQTGQVPVRGPHGLEVGPDTGVVFVLVPGGSVTMGARPPSPAAPSGTPHTDPRATDASAPVHEVVLDPFLIAKYELTQGQWLRLMGSNTSFHQPERGGFPSDLSLPVEFVSLDEAREASARFAATLPTEAQWEAAARAGTTTPWWSGDDQMAVATIANLSESAVEIDRWSDGFVDRVAPVGRFAPNPFGLHDVLGNVYEWTLDGWHPYAYTLPTDAGTGRRQVRDPTAFVARGGSYFDGLEMGRSAARLRSAADGRFRALGMRAVRLLPEP